MSSHHPPRECFRALAWDLPSLTVVATFTELRRSTPHTEMWSFLATDTPTFLTFFANPTGVWFNANVRESPDWTAVRLL